MLGSSIKLYDLIVRSASEGLKIQNTAGEYPSGHNGPWNDADTNVRTTAHWALITFKAYEITGEEKFLSSAIMACDYLIRKEVRPYGYTFYCRTYQKGRNMCNGLIGQAWAMEPLIFIGASLNNPEYLRVVRNVVLMHKYSRKYHAWNNTEINGTTLGINNTLNQQVWFAALSLTAGKILRDKELNDSAEDFFINLPLLGSYIEEKGLIRHEFNVHSCTFRSTVKKLISGKIKRAMHHDKINLLSQGYLSFVLYGLALVYERNSEEHFWNDDRLKIFISDAIDYIIDNLPFGWGEKTGYRWCYNPTGIEMAYVLQVFQKYLNSESFSDLISLFLNKQFEFYYDFEKNVLSKNTMDPAILSARLYEAVRLKNYNICMPN
ncbi:MAG: hypothetical protein NTW65_04555 [Deltaproteobacteria bacterium]|nr:hypothetical protein [Deltaproteobacteria bacterium]